ncbi:tRNA (guanine-N(7)-)-methyltransferase [Buchnera aphidicola (Eriosoma lanigerum)]|uniref:tRNA (guanosine(46)-N7)-methyltransferase TrmB n=1 Tax=Buchnera aphidicola TaxID=9 RepID=UPI0034645B2F
MFQNNSTFQNNNNKNYSSLYYNKSTVCRGRLTKFQKQSIVNLFPFFGLSFQHKYINFIEIFNRESPIVVEIGFGTGDNLINMAVNYPEKDFLGIELYLPGIAVCMHQAYIRNIKNLRVIFYNALEVIQFMVKDNQLNQVNIFFPDPWPKRKHHKRRMIQTSFISLIAKKLSDNGILHIATDWKPYAIEIIKYVKYNNLFHQLCIHDCYKFSVYSRLVTKFEKKGKNLGHEIFELLFQCIK